MYKGITIAFFCFLIFLSHIFIFHTFIVKRRFFTMIRILLFGVLVYIMLFCMINDVLVRSFIESLIPIPIFAFLNGVYLHLFFAFFYLYFIQIMDRTPTARIMVVIENSPQKKMTQEELERIYSFDKKISNILEDIVALGRLKKEKDSFAITEVGKTHMKFFKFIRDYLRLKRN